MLTSPCVISQAWYQDTLCSASYQMGTRSIIPGSKAPGA